MIARSAKSLLQVHAAEVCRNLMSDFDALVGRAVLSPGVKSSAA